MHVDEAKLQSFMEKMAGHMTGSTICHAVWLGDELGFYRELAGSGPRSADSVAEKTSCNPRLVREWLDGQAAAGLLGYDAASDTYELGAEAALALAHESSPAFVARSMSTFGAMFIDTPKLLQVFKGDGAMPWGDHHHCLFTGTEWSFRTGYRTYLTSSWIPALEGMQAKLEAGARVADIGCGHGASAVVMAQAYPKSRIFGFDAHAASIDTARARAAEAGVGERADFAVASATSYEGTYDLICFFDCLHDMGDPVGAARYARQHLSPGGAVLLVEPFALDGRGANIGANPVAALFYHASSVLCAPNSLSQDGRAALGAQAGEGRLRAVFEEAGFRGFRRAAETPMNLILEARP